MTFAQQVCFAVSVFCLSLIAFDMFGQWLNDYGTRPVERRNDDQ